jgi:uncharacterized membrane protein YfcA
MGPVVYIVLGVGAGILSGIFGIGGGTVLIPALIYLYGLTQHQAQGTTLAVMVPPIGLLAALRYYYSGNVRLDMVGYICAGFLIGGLLGAHLIQNVPDPLLKKGFGIFLMLIAVNMIWGK